MCQFNTEAQYLTCVLESYSMKHVKHIVEAQARKGEQLKAILARQFELPQPDYFPVNSGSIAKSTAINSKFDLDIIVPFPASSFGNLEQMAQAVAGFFEREYKDQELVRVRPNQSWSVGLMFDLKIGGKTERINIDIVPGVEVRAGQYPHDGMLWLKNTDNGGRTQTNLSRQKAHLKSRNEGVFKVIRLLKVWKANTTGIKPRSFLLELLVIKAFERVENQVPKGIWPQLKMVLELIRDHPKGLKLIDPGNGQNHVNELLREDEWTTFSLTVAKMLRNITSNPSRMREYFPDNMNYCMKQRY